MAIYNSSIEVRALRIQLGEAQQQNAQSAREIRRMEKHLAARDAQLGALREALNAALTITTANLGTVAMDVNVPRRALRQIRDRLDAALAAGGPEPQEPSQ